jgi:uncharacterized protein YndB with AHSA1/START domain
MTAPSVDHATFVIERTLKAPAARVFRAWSDLALKQQWNSCHDDWRSEEHRLDFRPGGSEISRVVEPDGTAHIMKAHYFDVVPDRRIVYAYEMYLDDIRISVSLVTVMFAPAGRAGATTSMTFTEQVTFLDGHGDLDERREGTEVGLRRLELSLAGAETTAS